MSVDARIREGLTMIGQQLPRVDTLERYHELGARARKQRRRRTTGKVIAAAAAVAAVAAGAAVVEAQLGQNRSAPPASPAGHRVLVTSSLVDTDYLPPVGDEWLKPLGKYGVRTYPYWASADPATQRFLINAETALEVMTPGQAEPLLRIACYDDGTGCLGAALGPGPQELTMVTGDFHLVVVGPDGEFARDLGPAGKGILNGLAWSPDGNTLAEAHMENGKDKASLTVVLRDPDSAVETTLYEYSEAAPPWYDAEDHRYADWPGAFNSWSLRLLADLQWAPDSTRLAFVTVTTPEGGNDDERQIQWKLFVADTATGEVNQIADLGLCAEPVDDDGGHGRVCDERGQGPSLTWTPDGANLTVLSDSTLITYDQTGKVLSSQPTDLKGPIAWMTSK